MGDTKDGPVARGRALQVALASAKGSPGVTSLALALGLVWPAPVIVGELDPSGGDLAGRLPLSRKDGLTALAAAAHQEMQGNELADCLQALTGTCSILLGPADPNLSKDAVAVLAPGLPVAARAARVAGLWDLGRLEPASPAWGALPGCDLIAVVVRPIAGEIAHAIPLVGRLIETGSLVAMVLASPRRGRRGQSESDLANVVAERVGQPVPMLARIPFDPLGVTLTERIMVHWAGRCALGAPVRELSDRIAATLAGNGTDVDEAWSPPGPRAKVSDDGEDTAQPAAGLAEAGHGGRSGLGRPT